MDAGAIPEYEHLRSKNIEDNNGKLMELGLAPMGASNFKRQLNLGYVSLNSNPFATDVLHLGWQVNNQLCYKYLRGTNEIEQPTCAHLSSALVQPLVWRG